MAYAERTEISIKKSIADAVTLVKRAGAVRILQYEEPGRFVLQFALGGRLIRFAVALPSIDDMPKLDGRRRLLTQADRKEKQMQAHRQRARALLLVIKAKLESVESKVETFEEAFLANVVMADDRTVYERVAAPIAAEYASGAPQLMLPGRRV